MEYIFELDDLSSEDGSRMARKVVVDPAMGA